MKTAFEKIRTISCLINFAFLLLSLIVYPLQDALVISLIFIPLMTLLMSMALIIPVIGQLVFCWFVYKFFLGFFFSIFTEVYVDYWFIHLVTVYCILMGIYVTKIVYRSIQNPDKVVLPWT